MTEARKGMDKKTRRKPAEAGGSATHAAVADDATRKGRSVGDVLRLEREKKEKTIEGVSAVINIRAAQLRALESGNLAALPGMTYAVGFLRSYAGYLGLDQDELVRRFKAEHTEVAEKPDLHFPVPVSQSHLPGPVVMAAAGIGAVVLLIVWAFVASSGDDEEKAVLADVPAVETVVAAADANTNTNTAVVATADPVAAVPTVDSASALAPAPVVALETGTSGVSVTGNVSPAPIAPVQLPVPEAVVPSSVVAVAPAAPVVPIPAAVAPVLPGVAEGAAVDAAATVAVADPASAEVLKPVVVPRVQPRPKDLLTATREFGERRSGSRVTIEALKPSWVQIMDKKENILFKKVLQPGEKYNVPSGPGLFLTTSNAGGLRLSVDGLAVQGVGGEGEIVRGISLEPAELSRFRIKTRR